jgi:hypothetical protein
MDSKEKNFETKPKDLYEQAKESHPEDVKRWEEEIKKLDQVVLKAKSKILAKLKRGAYEHKETPTTEVSEEVEDKAGVDLASRAKELTNLISGTTANEIGIDINDVVFIDKTNFGEIDDYKLLDNYQKKALKAVSLFSSLKVLPYQVMEAELGQSAVGEQKERWTKRDEEERRRWIEKRSLLEEILKEFKNVNFSKGGLVTPSYIKGVE